MTPKEQCEILLDKLLPFAEEQMKKHREFYPFAAVILTDDAVELTGSYDGGEHPESKDVINDLIQIHKQLAHVLFSPFCFAQAANARTITAASAKAIIFFIVQFPFSSGFVFATVSVTRLTLTISSFISGGG